MYVSKPEEQFSEKPAEYYARRSSQISGEIAESTGRMASLMLYIAVLVGGALLFFYQGFVRHTLPLWAGLIPVAGAVYVLDRRAKAAQRSKQLWRLEDLYARGTSRLNREWKELDPGTNFADRDHPYASDLDLFGVGSLYQLICSARTQIGRETLVNWMKQGADPAEIRARQEAVAELRERRELPELLATAGKTQNADVRADFVKSWAAEKTPGFPLYARVTAMALALAALAIPCLYFAHVIRLEQLPRFVLYVAAAQLWFGMMYRDQVKRVIGWTEPIAVEMPIVREIARLIEREDWKSERLRAVALRFKQHGAASVRIARLQRLIWLFRQRENEILIYISFCLLWSTQLAMAIETWRKEHGAELVDWLGALGEMEALISISTYAYEHPADPFPTIRDKAIVFDGVAVGHPMLDETSCVRNTVKLEAGGAAKDSQFLVISGSNMSGKSTFLRSIGMNAVLAAMGAPVRCTSLTISPLAICAAIRIEDSVIDGKSNFLAEMQRLKRMIDMAASGPVLFLADEIMAGTNSHDRRIATEWVVRALVKRGAIGALSTHDLALTEIAGNGLPGRNVYFEDSGENGALSFDYTLRTGILSRSNALNIAHLLGIDTAAETK
jgi:hypothetical protein